MSGRRRSRVRIVLTPNDLKENPGLIDLVRDSFSNENVSVDIKAPRPLERPRPADHLSDMATDVAGRELEDRRLRAQRGESVEEWGPDFDVDAATQDPDIEIHRQTKRIIFVLAGLAKRLVRVVAFVKSGWVEKAEDVLEELEEVSSEEIDEE